MHAATTENTTEAQPFEPGGTIRSAAKEFEMRKKPDVETDMNQYGSLRNPENVCSKSPLIIGCYPSFIGKPHFLNQQRFW